MYQHKVCHQWKIRLNIFKLSAGTIDPLTGLIKNNSYNYRALF